MLQKRDIKKYLSLIIVLLSMMLPDVAMAQNRYRVGVCDWMVLKRQKLGEFKLAKELGCDGLEMDMGGLGKRDSFDNKMRQPEMARKFRHTADSLGIEVGAVAMSGFYGQSFARKKSWRWLVEDCLNTMDVMDATVAFLPLGGCGNNWTDSLPLRREIVERLHEAGEMAHRRGKVIGIDTPLDAKGNKRLLREIGSKGIKIFYKLQTAVEHRRQHLRHSCQQHRRSVAPPRQGDRHAGSEAYARQDGMVGMAFRGEEPRRDRRAQREEELWREREISKGNIRQGENRQIRAYR